MQSANSAWLYRVGVALRAWASNRAHSTRQVLQLAGANTLSWLGPTHFVSTLDAWHMMQALRREESTCRSLIREESACCAPVSTALADLIIFRAPLSTSRVVFAHSSRCNERPTRLYVAMLLLANEKAFVRCNLPNHLCRSAELCSLEALAL